MATQQARRYHTSDSQDYWNEGLQQYQQIGEEGPSEQDKQLAKALGWFGILLGLAQFLAPRQVSELIGVDYDHDTRNMMRGLGVREITSGVGILMRDKPTGWLQARVMGDVMDLGLLGTAMTSKSEESNRTVAAILAVLGVTVLDLVATRRLSRASHLPQSVTSSQKADKPVMKSITINRPIEEVYAFWHNFENLPRFMSHLESVQVTGDRRSHWKAKAPAGTTVEWDAEMTEDSPNERIAWRSLEGADVYNTGSVNFEPAPGNRGTEVHVELEYKPPAGKLGKVVAKLLGEEPDIQVADDLRAFKQVIETGEVVIADGSIQGRRLKHRPAQPPADSSDWLIESQRRNA
jgi:uncharacterized membrane protein/uncharacterized protein YjeT (DUF2065 family)